MTVESLISMLTEGLPAEQAAIVKAAVERDAVKAKATALKDQSELDSLIQERTRILQAELEGTTDAPGTRAYRDWYNKHYQSAKENYEAIQKYEEKHGKGSFARAVGGEAPTTVSQPGGGMTKEEIQALMREQIREEYSKNQAPNIATVLKTTGRIVQRHMFAGRKSEIDFDALDNIINEQAKLGKNITVEDAYNIWDRPEQEKSAKAAEDARVEQRVKDELAKRGNAGSFPPAADFTPGAMSDRTKADVDKYDPVALKQQLAKDWYSAGETAA